MPKLKVKGGDVNGSVQEFYQGHVLIYLECRKWGASAKLTDEKSEEYLKEDKDVIRAVQDVLLPEDKALLESMASLKNQALGVIYRNSVPSPIPNFNCLPKERIEPVEELLLDFQKQYYDLSKYFVSKRDEYETRYKEKKPDLYRPEKYPSTKELERRFVFRWTYQQISPPDPKLGVLSPDLYKREVENFKGLIKEMQVNTLRVIKASAIERLDAVRLMCEGKKFNQATINSVNNLLEKVEQVYGGFIDSKELKALVGEIDLYMKDVDADMLRADEDFADMVAKMAGDVSTKIEKIREPKSSGRALMF
jgi:hypothetical protein